MIIKHKEQCDQKEITSIRTSNQCHIYWKKHFQNSLFYFSIYADFDADNEIDNCRTGSKTTNFYKQNTVCNGYYTVSELEDVLKRDYFKSPLVYENVDWFVIEVITLEKNGFPF